VTDRDHVIVDRWYRPAAAACPLGTGVCTVSPGILLKAGAVTWNVLTWNAAGYGPWSATRDDQHQRHVPVDRRVRCAVVPSVDQQQWRRTGLLVVHAGRGWL
jgi:hypothetical protein